MRQIRFVLDPSSGSVGEVTRIEGSLTFAFFRRTRDDGTSFIGEECHLTKELVFNHTARAEDDKH